MGASTMAEILHYDCLLRHVAVQLACGSLECLVVIRDNLRLLLHNQQFKVSKADSCDTASC